MNRKEQGQLYLSLLEDKVTYPTQKILAKKMHVCETTVTGALKHIGHVKRHATLRIPKVKPKKSLTRSHRNKIRLSNTGNYRIKPNEPITYAGIHARVRQKYGKPNTCDNPNCKRNGHRFEWSNKYHTYKIPINKKDWQQLCSFCHRNYDKYMKFI